MTGFDGWDLPSPAVARIAVVPADIDAYGHVNNAVYVGWFDQAAWAHSAALGLGVEACVALDRGMAVLRSTIVYLKPALAGDQVEVGTWLVEGDAKLRVSRRFQVRRTADGATLARAHVEYVCIQLSNGRPRPMPPEFRARYVELAETAAARTGLAPL